MKKWTFNLLSESTYDWNNEQWSVPIIGVVSKVTRIANQTVSIGLGVRYWVESPENGAEGLGGRLVMTFLFPK